MSSTRFQMDKTVWGVVSAVVVEQSRRTANTVAHIDGEFGSVLISESLLNQNQGKKAKLRKINKIKKEVFCTHFLKWHPWAHVFAFLQSWQDPQKNSS